MKKIFLGLVLLLAGCTPQDFGSKAENCGWFGCKPGETSSSQIGRGQWTTATSVGKNKFMVKGHRPDDAIKGAALYCQSINKQLELDNINEKNVAIFSCL